MLLTLRNDMFKTTALQMQQVAACPAWQLPGVEARHLGGAECMAKVLFAGSSISRRRCLSCSRQAVMLARQHSAWRLPCSWRMGQGDQLTTGFLHAGADRRGKLATVWSSLDKLHQLLTALQAMQSLLEGCQGLCCARGGRMAGTGHFCGNGQ